MSGSVSDSIFAPGTSPAGTNALMMPGIGTAAATNPLAPTSTPTQQPFQFDPRAAMQWMQQQMQSQQQAQQLQQQNPAGIDPQTMAALQASSPFLATLGALGGVPNPYAGVGQPGQPMMPQQPWGPQWSWGGQGAEAGSVGGAAGNQAAAGVGTAAATGLY